MSILEAVVLGAIEGVTEFLPISSTGHLTVGEELLGFNIDADDITAFTAIIQVGAIAAVVIYFWDDIRGDRHRRSPGVSAAARRGRRATSATAWRSPWVRSRSAIVGLALTGRDRGPAAQPLGGRGRADRCGAS